VVVWDIFPRFGMLHQEKSGNPAFKLAGGFILKENAQAL
jgi:hypothetical protein